MKEIGKAHYLTSRKADYDRRYIVYTKKKLHMLGQKDQAVLSRIRNASHLFVRADLDSKSNSDRKNKEGRREAKSENRRKAHKEGDLVGHTASEIGQDNVGRLLLEKMGWRTGMGLGASSVGIIEPIMARIKRSKVGITTTSEVS